MASKRTRTEWRAIALDMSIESSVMEVLVRGRDMHTRTQTRPITRVMFRTESGRVFSGPRISKALGKELESLAASYPWAPVPPKKSPRRR